MPDEGAWRTIDSAPKDGTLLLLGHTEWEEVVIGGWFKNLWQFADLHPLQKLHVERNAWQPGYGPTHWMPLPPPPKDSNNERSEES